MSDITADQYVKYVDVIGLKAVSNSLEKSLTNIVTFFHPLWRSDVRHFKSVQRYPGLTYHF